MSRPPSWLTRWGNTLIAGILLLIIALCFVIQYPDRITGEVILSTQTPYSRVIAQESGYIEHLMVHNSDVVQKGEVLAIIQNTADYQDIQSVQKVFYPFLNALTQNKKEVNTRFPYQVKLGKLQESYTSFLTYYQQFLLAHNTPFYLKKVTQLQQQIQQEKNIQQQLDKQQVLLHESIALIEQKVNGGKKLIQHQGISQYDLIALKQELINARYQSEELQSSLIQSKAKEHALLAQLTALQESHNITTQTSFEALKTAALSFQFHLNDWEQKYLLKAPISGTVTFFHIMDIQQFVKKGEEVLTILPSSNTFNAFVYTKGIGVGKIKKGNTVRITLKNYPAEEFGTLKGIVHRISPIARDGAYKVEVQLPQQLKTNYGKVLNFQHDMKGEATIITQNLRLIDRFFHSVLKRYRDATQI
ncbi:HlyD family efflux transporter periplasmic adaptor subunit [Algivirga pacifica]|uniref:HlyD family efflux transporter periplasmic adaptor subunit n=2 Tax=Algivirga pacifica TaxID=1162670 RepID=A0ABP9DIN2_9BACT